MIKRRRYKTPPIEEALCEFRFEPRQSWDIDYAHQMRTELKADYPGEPRMQQVLEVELKVSNDQSPEVAQKEALGKTQLLTENGRRIVGIGPDVLSVHMLRPYQDDGYPHGSGWDEFRHRISGALEAYCRVVQPEAVKRIGVRYVNKIVLPPESSNLEDYLTCVERTSSGLPQSVNWRFARVEYSYGDEVLLALSHGTAEKSGSQPAYILDLDVIWQGANAISMRESLEKVEELRSRERVAFENLITNKSRNLFDEI